MFRHKSKVAGWWKLWPETVTLLEQWRIEAESILKRKVKDSDRITITQSGESMYTTSKNGQSKFAKEFNEVRTAAKVKNYHWGLSGISCRIGLPLHKETPLPVVLNQAWPVLKNRPRLVKAQGGWRCLQIVRSVSLLRPLANLHLHLGRQHLHR